MMRTAKSLIVLGVSLLLVASLKAQPTDVPANPPFDNLSFNQRFSDLIRQSDPSAFKSMTYEGQRTKTFTNDVKKRAHVFTVEYRDGLTIAIHVSSEFAGPESAEIEAKKYAIEIGRIPTLLRLYLKRATLERSDYVLAASRHGYIYIRFPDAVSLERGRLLEEVLLHEAVHTQSDFSRHVEEDGWLDAKNADPTFVCEYCRSADREDIAESLVAYFAVKYRPDRITERDANLIRKSIPNRIAYFDSLNTEGLWCPVVPDDCRPDEATESTAVEHSLLKPRVDGDDGWMDLRQYRSTVLRHFETTESEVETQILFVNDTETDISVCWVNYRGRRVDCEVIAADESATRDTYKGHLWAVKDPNGEIFAVFQAESRTGRALVRKNPETRQ